MADEPSSPGLRGQLSSHFTAAEFGCPHCGVALVRPELLAKLEQLRKLVGRPLRIVSGYRCPTHNRAVGGAANSQHMYGAAVDLPLGAATPAQAEGAGFTGIGRQAGSARHVDVRDGPPARWSY